MLRYGRCIIGDGGEVNQSSSMIVPTPRANQRSRLGTRIAPRPPHRSRRALLTHRAPPLGRTSAAPGLKPHAIRRTAANRIDVVARRLQWPANHEGATARRVEVKPRRTGLTVNVNAT
jgi:hypothetical protein